jgi:hypothetical protein
MDEGVKSGIDRDFLYFEGKQHVGMRYVSFMWAVSLTTCLLLSNYSLYSPGSWLDAKSEQKNVVLKAEPSF